MIDMDKSIPYLRTAQTKHGKSVFVDRPFDRGEFILKFRGRAYSKSEYLTALQPANCHFLQIGCDCFLGPSEHVSDFVNHSCCPNTAVHVVDDRAFLFTLRNLRRGEEITFDYSTTMAEEHWEMNCSCGSCVCRGRVRDFRYLPRVLQEAYIRQNMVPAFVLQSMTSELRGSPN